MKFDPTNIIHHDVKISPNVKIGKNNIINSGTRILPNTIIGDNNIIFQNNIIGLLPVQAGEDHANPDTTNLIIGNGNFFHENNKISMGCKEKTIIGNNCKFLSDVYISHDNIIEDGCIFYPRVFSAGFVKFGKNSNIGAGAFIHQRLTIGCFSMIGMNCTITKNVASYMICVNNKYTRLNKKRLGDHYEKNKKEFDQYEKHIKIKENHEKEFCENFMRI